MENPKYILKPIVIVYNGKTYFKNCIYAHLHLFYFDISQLCNLIIFI